jgi:outer membrane protein assembly factor BamB
MKNLGKQLNTLMIIIVFLGLSKLIAQNPENTYKLDGKINFMKLTDAGVLLIANGDGLAGIRPRESKLVFDFKDYGSVKEEELQFVPNSPYVIITQGGLLQMSSKKSIVDYVSGLKIFDSKEKDWKQTYSINVFVEDKLILVYGQRKTLEIGVYDMLTGKEKNTINIIEPGKVTMGNVGLSGSIYLNNDKLYIPTAKQLLCYNIKTGAKIWESKKDDITWITTDTSGQNIYTFEVTNGGDTKINKVGNDGRVLWKDDQKVKGAVSRFEILPQGLVVVSDVTPKGESVFAANAESKIMLFDANTGNDLWDKAPKTKGYVQHFYVMEDGILYGIQSGGINKISFDGTPLFKKPLKTGENIHIMALTPKGVIYITDEDANIIDLKTGESIWDKPIKFKRAQEVTSTYDEARKRYLISTGSEIIAIAENSGDVSELASYKFEEKEAPTDFSIRKEGLLLTSSQNMMMLNFDGSEKFHEYYKSPSRSTFGKIMGGITAVASTTLMVASAAKARANTNSLGQYNREGREANRAADMFAGISGASFEYMSKRFKASSATKDAQFILTKLNDGVGLIVVNKDSGKSEKEIVLKDKKPEYIVDDFGGVLYYRANGSTIQAFDLTK